MLAVLDLKMQVLVIHPLCYNKSGQYGEIWKMEYTTKKGCNNQYKKQTHKQLVIFSLMKSCVWIAYKVVSHL